MWKLFICLIVASDLVASSITHSIIDQNEPDASSEDSSANSREDSQRCEIIDLSSIGEDVSLHKLMTFVRQQIDQTSVRTDPVKATDPVNPTGLVNPVSSTKSRSNYILKSVKSKLISKQFKNNLPQRKIEGYLQLPNRPSVWPSEWSNWNIKRRSIVKISNQTSSVNAKTNAKSNIESTMPFGLDNRSPTIHLSNTPNHLVSSPDPIGSPSSGLDWRLFNDRSFSPSIHRQITKTDHPSNRPFNRTHHSAYETHQSTPSYIKSIHYPIHHGIYPNIPSIHHLNKLDNLFLVNKPPTKIGRTGQLHLAAIGVSPKPSNSKNSIISNSNRKNANNSNIPADKQAEARFNLIDYPLRASRQCYHRKAIEPVEFHLNIINRCVGQLIESNFCGPGTNLIVTQNCSRLVRRSIQELSEAKYLACIGEQFDSFVSIQNLFEETRLVSVERSERMKLHETDSSETSLDERDSNETTIEGELEINETTSETNPNRSVSQHSQEISNGSGSNNSNSMIFNHSNGPTKQLLLIRLIHSKSNSSRLIWPTNLIDLFSSSNWPSNSPLSPLSLQFTKVSFNLIQFQLVKLTGNPFD